jgi:hypothetical protein
MFTTLPQSINTIEEAKKFLTELHENGESFHPEDDANDIVWYLNQAQIPSKDECDQLNKLMNDIYSLPGNDDVRNMAFDPCQFLLDLFPKDVSHFEFDENGDNTIVTKNII